MKNEIPYFPVMRTEKIYGISLSAEKEHNWHQTKSQIIEFIKGMFKKFPAYTPEMIGVSRIHIGIKGSLNVVWSNFRAFMALHDDLNKILYEITNRDVVWHHLEGHDTDYICSLDYEINHD